MNKFLYQFIPILINFHIKYFDQILWFAFRDKYADIYTIMD